MVIFFIELITMFNLTYASQQINTLNIPIAIENIIIDPRKIKDGDTLFVLNQIFHNLVYKNENDQFAGQIADKWYYSHNGLKLNFIIRSDLFWSDGTQIQAKEIKTYYEDAVRYNPSVRWIFGPILGIDQFISHQNDHIIGIEVRGNILSFKFEKPFTIILNTLTSGSAKIGKRASSNKWIGTGPYVQTDNNKKKIVLSAKNKENPIQTINFLYNNKQDLIQADDYFLSFIKESYVKSEGILNNVNKIICMPDNSIKMLIFNMRTWIGKDLNLRRRLRTILLNNKNISAHGTINPEMTFSLIPNGFLGHWKNDKNINDNITFRKNTPFNLLHTTGWLSRSQLEISNLTLLFKKEGINFYATELSYKDLIKRYYSKKFELATLNYTPDYMHPDAYYYPLIHSGGEYNFMSYKNEAVDNLLELSRTEWDETLVLQYYEKINHILSKDVPIIPVYNSQQCLIHSKPLTLPKSRQGYIYMDLSKIKINGDKNEKQ